MKNLKVKSLKVLSSIVAIAGICALVACVYYQYPPFKVLLYLPFGWSDRAQQILGAFLDFNLATFGDVMASLSSLLLGFLLLLGLPVHLSEAIKDWAKSIELGPENFKAERAKEQQYFQVDMIIGSSGTFNSINWIGTDTVVVESTSAVYFCRAGACQASTVGYFKDFPYAISKTAHVWVMDGKLHIGHSAKDSKTIVFEFHAQVTEEVKKK